MSIDRDTIIDWVAAIDTKFMKSNRVHNLFDKYELFALHVAAAAKAEEREACAKLCDELETSMKNGKRTKDGDRAAFTAGILAERIRARGQE